MGYAAIGEGSQRLSKIDFKFSSMTSAATDVRSSPQSGYSPADYASDLEAILDELAWDAIHLVGHSMGGRVQFHFAAENPQRVTRLVIEDIGPSMQESGASLVLRMLERCSRPVSE